MTMSVYAVIMAGGSGTRLWPLSRAHHPKFLLCPDGQKSFIEQTLRRLRRFSPRFKLKIVCGRFHVRSIRNQIPRLTARNFVVEPVARNTAACIGLAVIRILREDSEATVVILPADHLIEKESAFRKVIRRAVAFSQRNDLLVTVGILPTRAHTGYGYIERGNPPHPPFDKGERGGIYKVRRFVEKPSPATARRFLKSGRFYWNAGIFIGKASLFLREIRRFMPGLYRDLVAIHDGRDLEVIYRRLKNESIDYGVMEKSDRIWVIPGDFGWKDVGDLVELSPFATRKQSGNLILGKVLSLDSEENIVYGGKRLIVNLGVRNLVIADTEDALLIADRSSAQKVKKVTELLRKKGLGRYV